MRVLVTGATGYVGGRLVPLLVRQGHQVRTTTTGRRPGPWWTDQVETVRMDVLDRRQVDAACDGIDAVFYLIHGMSGDDFAESDRTAATHVRDAVDKYGVSRVVYLSGIVPPVEPQELSDHISSRLEVERILTASSATVITLRAAILLGSGSTSFEIIRQISERLPVQTIPDWMDSVVQPIAVVDVLQALLGALTAAGPSRHYDVGGPDRMSYTELLSTYTDVAGLARPQIEVPLLPTRLVGWLVGQLTDVPASTAEALVESLHHDMVCTDTDFVGDLLPPSYQLLDVAESIRRSLLPNRQPPDQADPMTRLPQDPVWAQDTPTSISGMLLKTVTDLLPGLDANQNTEAGARDPSTTA